MEIVFGVEANRLIEEIPEFLEFFIKETGIKDRLKHIFIFETCDKALFAKNLLQEGGLFEDLHPLVEVEEAVLGDCYFDYTLLSSEHDKSYLFGNMVGCFTIHLGEPENIQMFTYQLEEHLILKTMEQAIIYYMVDHTLTDLIRGIAVAYDIEVSFLDLDKCKKKL